MLITAYFLFLQFEPNIFLVRRASNLPWLLTPKLFPSLVQIVSAVHRESAGLLRRLQRTIQQRSLDATFLFFPRLPVSALALCIT